jgi:hypothetical protein
MKWPTGETINLIDLSVYCTLKKVSPVLLLTMYNFLKWQSLQFP